MKFWNLVMAAAALSAWATWAVCAPAIAAEREGGGGSMIAAQFVELGQTVATHVSYPGIEKGRLLDIISQVRVEPTTNALTIESRGVKVTVDAVNYPTEKHIVFNSVRWLQMDANSRRLLVLHEYLGVGGFNDDGYRISLPALGSANYTQVNRGIFQSDTGSYYGWYRDTGANDERCGEFAPEGERVGSRISLDLCRSSVGSSVSWYHDTDYDAARCGEFSPDGDQIDWRISADHCRAPDQVVILPGKQTAPVKPTPQMAFAASARMTALRAIRLVESLVSLANPQNARRYLLPIKAQAGLLNAVTAGGNHSEIAVVKNLAALNNKIVEAEPYLASFSARDADFKPARDLVAIEAKIQTLLKR